MAPSERARKNHDELFPGHVSTLAVTDPELIERKEKGKEKKAAARFARKKGKKGRSSICSLTITEPGVVRVLFAFPLCGALQCQSCQHVKVTGRDAN